VFPSLSLAYINVKDCLLCEINLTIRFFTFGIFSCGRRATLLSIQEYDESFIADSKLIVDLLFEKGASFDQIVSPIFPKYANGLLLDLILKENPRPESFYELMVTSFQDFLFSKYKIFF
jgi:hypothetical protein